MGNDKDAAYVEAREQEREGYAAYVEALEQEREGYVRRKAQADLNSSERLTAEQLQSRIDQVDAELARVTGEKKRKRLPKAAD